MTETLAYLWDKEIFIFVNFMKKKIFLMSEFQEEPQKMEQVL